MKRLNEAQRKLVEDHLFVVDLYVRRHCFSSSCTDTTEDDLRQVGYIALCNAALHYSKGSSFATYAHAAVRNSLAQHFRILYRMPVTVSLDSAPDDDKSALAGFLPDPHSGRCFDELESLDILHRLQQKHTGVVRKGIQAMEQKYQGFTDIEIARGCGSKRQSVNAWISKARAKLQHDHELRHTMTA